MSRFSADVSMDIGTSNSLIIVRGTDVKLREPSFVAYDVKKKKVIAVGHEAKVMYGRSHKEIEIIRPIKDSVIGNFEMATAMIDFFMKRIKQRVIFKPRVMVGVPTDISEVERRAVHEAVRLAGARTIYLVEQSLASAIGIDLPVMETRGHMILDLGGGKSEISVISYGGIVLSRSIKIAGEKLDEAIQAMVRKKYNLLIGDITSEEVKIAIGSAVAPEKIIRAIVKGRDMTSGLPRAIHITNEDVYESMQENIRSIVELVKTGLESTPPELIGDIIDYGILMTGGLSQLKGIDTILSKSLKLTCKVIQDPSLCVVRGLAKIFKEPRLMTEIFKKRKRAIYREQAEYL